MRQLCMFVASGCCATAVSEEGPGARPLLPTLTDYQNRLMIVQANLEAIQSNFLPYIERTACNLQYGAREPFLRPLSEIDTPIVRLGGVTPDMRSEVP